MTLSCRACGSADVEIVRDNGAEHPQTRVEWYRCRNCQSEFKKVLTA